MSNPADQPPFGEGTLGEFADSPLVKLPDLATFFARRAERLESLAAGNELEGFLRLVAMIVRAQHTALSSLPPGRLPGREDVATALGRGSAPLDPGRWPRDPDWRAALKAILAALPPEALTDDARAAQARLAGAADGELEAVADRVLKGELRADDKAGAPFVAAALQVAWTRMAGLLDPADFAGQTEENGSCPVCGSHAVAGTVLPGGTRFGHRLLNCSLCGTAWRYARVKCAHCGSTDKISFRNLAGTTFLRAECCENCHGYTKLFYPEKARAVEPLADDLASLGLDLLVGEEGFGRAPNPFVQAAMEPQEG
ncbi:MAG: formate dehydrogenase accessory protein FdhE [Alphaproteobacteria bacterium]|nr:formate dehydrogenase accessory protein FdhE [Alphaproteobacteria bacterium]